MLTVIFILRDFIKLTPRIDCSLFRVNRMTRIIQIIHLFARDILFTFYPAQHFNKSRLLSPAAGDESVRSIKFARKKENEEEERIKRNYPGETMRRENKLSLGGRDALVSNVCVKKRDPRLSIRENSRGNTLKY